MQCCSLPTHSIGKISAPDQIEEALVATRFRKDNLRKHHLRTPMEEARGRGGAVARDRAEGDGRREEGGEEGVRGENRASEIGR